MTTFVTTRPQPHSSDTAPPVWREPEGPEGQTAVPVGGGGAWPDDQWAADVTNVSTPGPTGVEGAGGTGGPDCSARGRRRGLAGQRADAPSHTSVHPAPLVWRAPEGPAAVPVGAGGTCRGAGGRRRGLARLRADVQAHVSTPSAAGVEGAGGSGGHGRASRSTTPSRRLACGDLAGGRARRRPEHQRSHKQQHTARTSRGRAAAHRHTQRPGPPAPETPVGPQAARPASTTQRNEAATGCPATASSRSRSAVHNSATSNQAVMST